MKSSLLALALLMSVAASAQNAPPLTPIQLIPAAAVIKPQASAKPVAVKSSSDEEALRQLRQAEAEFKAKKPVALPAAPVAPVTVTPVVVVAKPAVVMKPVTPIASNNQQLPSIRRSTPVIRVAPRPRVATNSAMTAMDAASILASHCAASNKPLRCMNMELNTAELRLDSAEVRLLNCREIRKFDTSLDKGAIDQIVTGRMYQLRFKATQAFNEELANAGRLSKFRTKELELRATISHLNAVSALDAKVCSARKFAKLYEEAKASN